MQDPIRHEVKVGLAPMEGVTDLPTRLWFSLLGPLSYASTPFLRVTAGYLPRSMPQTFAPELTDLKGCVPYQLIPQVMTSDPDDLVRLGEALLKNSPLVELNCGCPSSFVVGSGAGSSLLKSPKGFRSFISGAVDRLGKEHLAVKMRVGFETEHEFPDLIEALADLPLARLSIHGRTRSEGYRGTSRWNFINDATKICPFPVWGSGDVCNDDGLRSRIVCAPGVEGALIGRGALRNPWLFRLLANPNAQLPSLDSLFQSLIAFIVLQHARHHNMDAILKLANDGLFMGTNLANSVEEWRSLNAKLCEAVFGREHIPGNLAVHPKLLPRVKMLWNYIRTSLSEDAFRAPILRTTSVQDFFDLTQITLQREAESGKNTAWQPARDWIFAGAARN